MPIRPIRNTGGVGINKDTSPVLLPPEGWSDGRNVRFKDGSVHKIKGHQSILTTDAEPINLLYWDYNDTYLYANDSDIFTVDATNTSTKVSKSGGYDSDGFWHSSLFNGGYTAIFNNTVEPPQYLQQGGSAFADLPAWPTGYKVGVLRPFQNVLIGGNITRTVNNNDTEMPGTILVSSQAAPGALPASWTVGASLTTTADEFELSNTSPVTEIVGYRGQCFIFTEDSIHSLTLAQGSSPTRVQNLNYSNGCLAIGCVTEFEGGLFAVDKHDIYTTSGSGQINSVSNHKMREYFFDNLNPDHYTNTFVATNSPKDEIWLCFPNLDANTNGSCNEALIWNYRDDTWSIRDLPNVFAATLGPIPEDGSFDKQRFYIAFNGYRQSNASQEQQVTASGKQSNTETPEPGIFRWTLSGASNTVVEGVQEVQTATVAGDIAGVVGVTEVQTLTVSGSQEDIPGVADSQRFTLSGRSNVISDDNKEIVDFGVHNDFESNAGPISTANYLDLKFSGTIPSGNTPTSDSYAFVPSISGGATYVNHNATSTNITTMEDFVDYLVSTYNASSSTNKLGAASKAASDTLRITLDSDTFYEVVSGATDVGISSWYGGSLIGTVLEITSNAFDDDFTVTSGNNQSILDFNITLANGDTTLYGIGDYRATFSISNASHDIPAITGSFTSEANAATARDDLKTALENDAEFVALFDHDTDTDIAAVNGGWDCKIEEIPSDRNSASVFVFLPNENHNILTIGSDATIEDIVDLIVAATWTNTVSKQSADTIRITGSGPLTAARIGNNTFGFGLGSSGWNGSGTLTISQTDIHNSSVTDSGSDTSQGYSAFTEFASGTESGSPIRQVTRWSSKSDSDFEDFAFTITENSGENTDPYLNVVQQGTDTEIPASMYTLRDPGGAEVVMFSSSVGSSSDNDRASILSTLETAVDNNTETPINYTATVNNSANHITLTADEVGAADDWTLTVNHGTGSGTLASTHSIHAAGKDIVEANVLYTITAPDGSTDSERLTGTLDTDAIATRLADGLAYDNWTLSHTGNTVVFTYDTDSDISGTFSYSDSEKANNTDGVSGSFVVTTQGVTPRTADLTMTLTDTDGGSEYTFEFVGDHTAAEIATRLRDTEYSGWETSGSGTSVVFTRDIDKAITGLWKYSDSGTDAGDTSVTFVETTAGVNEVEASTFTLTDDDDTTLATGTFASASNTDTSGTFIVDRPTQRGVFTYDSDQDQLTFTYDNTGPQVRPTLGIVNTVPVFGNADGDLAVTSVGSDTSGTDGNVGVSTYTISLPSGFSPESVSVTAINETRSGVLEAIRDAINEVDFAPSDISASVIGDNLILAWSDFNVATLFTTTIDNDGGNGDIAFASAVENEIIETSTEIHAADRSNTFNGESFLAFVERKVFDAGDLQATKWSSSVYPLISGTGNVTIKVKGTNIAGKTVDFSEVDGIEYDIDEDYKVDPRDNARFFNIRIESDDNDEWTLDGYSTTVQTDGDRR